ncbi:MAG: rane-fusion protein [Cyanobacteria bacterium RYN_339]|nr:rane-fusion protein [Cyanobacteria bacterium RYN_339]
MRSFRPLLVAALLVGCAPAQRLPTPIAVRQGPFAVDLRTNGTVEPLDSHPVALPPGVWGGNVDALVPEGRQVKQGDFIARVSNRRIVEQLLDKQDELARDERGLERAKADAPVKQWEVKQEINERKQGWREKDLLSKTALRGGAPDQVAAAKKDVKLVDLAIANDPLAAEQRLFEKGVVARQELERVKRDHDIAELDKRRALLALARLAPGALHEEVEKARLDASMAKAAFESASLEGPAKRDLIKVEQEKSRVRIRGLAKEVKRLKKKVDSATLYAPADGMLLYPMIWNWKKVHVGMQVWNGLTFLSVARLDAVKLKGAVSEAEIGRVAVGAKAEITTAAYPGRIFLGKVTQVSKLAKEEDSRRGERTSGVKRFDIEVRPDVNTPELKPNMRVSLRVVGQELPSASAVPAEALFGEGTGRWIWLASPKGPQKQAVTPKLWGSDWVALEQTLPPGAQVYLVDPTQPLAPEVKP